MMAAIPINSKSVRSKSEEMRAAEAGDRHWALLTVAAGHSPRAEVIPYQQPGAMRNYLFVRQLEIDARIGVYYHEKDRVQRVLVDLEFAMTTELACQTDCLSDAVDYAKVVERVRAIAMDRHYELVESLAETITFLLRRQFGVPWVRLSLAKLEPFPGAQVGVVIERGQRG